MKKGWYIIMAKTLVYESMNDHTLNHLIYIIGTTQKIEEYTTTANTVVKDICHLCETEDIDTIHLYGSSVQLNFLKNKILSNNIKFNYQNINFIFN